MGGGWKSRSKITGRRKKIPGGNQGTESKRKKVVIGKHLERVREGKSTFLQLFNVDYGCDKDDNNATCYHRINKKKKKKNEDEN